MQTILVIEDEQPVRDMMIDTLEAHHYHVLAAEAGEPGIALAQQHLPDLIICDVMMPGMDGHAVLDRVRADQHIAATPFIIVTARSERENMRDGMEQGADDYIPKPFSSSELIRAVEAQFKKHATVAAKYEASLRTLRRNITYALPHELRTPLMIILGYSQMMMQDAKASANGTLKAADIEEMSSQVFDAAKRLNRVTENYLALAQIEILESDPEQRAALRQHTVPDTGKVISDEVRKVALRHDREVDVALQVTNLPARIAEDTLRKIVEELTDNALKFSQPGDRVYIRSQVSRQDFTIWVRDFGRGMSEPHIRQLGEYMQFGRAVHEQQGLGLGFTVARRLVELHNGTLQVKSAPDKGTLLTIELPQRD